MSEKNAEILKVMKGNVTEGTTDASVLPVHIVWHDEATAKSTTQYGRRYFTLKKSHFTAEIQS